MSSSPSSAAKLSGVRPLTSASSTGTPFSCSQRTRSRLLASMTARKSAERPRSSLAWILAPSSSARSMVGRSLCADGGEQALLEGERLGLADLAEAERPIHRRSRGLGGSRARRGLRRAGNGGRCGCGRHAVLTRGEPECAGREYQRAERIRAEHPPARAKAGVPEGPRPEMSRAAIRRRRARR